MSVDNDYTPPPPPPTGEVPARVRTRTTRLIINTELGRPYSFVAVRERIYMNAANEAIPSPAGASLGYEFSVEVTAALIAANQNLAQLIQDIATFVDSVDPVLHPPT